MSRGGEGEIQLGIQIGILVFTRTQTGPGFHVFIVQIIQKHNEKRRNC